MVAVADPIKATTPAALESLRADGIRVVMLTGDNRRTAEAIARRLGIAEVEADVLPEDKNRVVRALRAAGKVVAIGLNYAMFSSWGFSRSRTSVCRVMSLIAFSNGYLLART